MGPRIIDLVGAFSHVVDLWEDERKAMEVLLTCFSLLALIIFPNSNFCCRRHPGYRGCYII